MATQKTVTGDEWLAARLGLLEQEKALTRQRDAVSRARRALPRVRVDKDYVFQGMAIWRLRICLTGAVS